MGRAVTPPGSRANHLASVPDPDDPDLDPDSPDPLHASITDTDLTFVGALGPLKIDARSSALQIQLILDPQSPITHKDFAALRHRHLQVTVTPVTRTGKVADPRIDPVAEQVETRRITRMVNGWVAAGRAPEHPDPDFDDLP